MYRAEPQQNAELKFEGASEIGGDWRRRGEPSIVGGNGSQRSPVGVANFNLKKKKEKEDSYSRKSRSREYVKCVESVRKVQLEEASAYGCLKGSRQDTQRTRVGASSGVVWCVDPVFSFTWLVVPPRGGGR